MAFCALSSRLFPTNGRLRLFRFGICRARCPEDDAGNYGECTRTSLSLLPSMFPLSSSALLSSLLLKVSERALLSLPSAAFPRCLAALVSVLAHFANGADVAQDSTRSQRTPKSATTARRSSTTCYSTSAGSASTKPSGPNRQSSRRSMRSAKPAYSGTIRTGYVRHCLSAAFPLPFLSKAMPFLAVFLSGGEDRGQVR